MSYYHFIILARARSSPYDAACIVTSPSRHARQARLVLIVDMWHPELQTDEQRVEAMQDSKQRQRYLGVVERGFYETTTLRGH